MSTLNTRNIHARAIMTTTSDNVPPFISTTAFLTHWQGHRRLTRRVIEAFPEDTLFSHTIGGMRPFGEMVMEMLSMAAPMVRGVATGQWETSWDRDPIAKDEMLRQWDAATEEVNELWPRIPAERFAEKMTAFGQYEDVAYNLILYVVDNETHHRGQGYVYLRSLGIEPPAFYER